MGGPRRVRPRLWLAGAALAWPALALAWLAWLEGPALGWLAPGWFPAVARAEASRPAPAPGAQASPPELQQQPAGADGTLRLELDAGAKASVTPPRVTAEGGVTAYFRESVIRAQRLEYDDERRVATFTGEVELRQPGRTVHGRRLTYELDEERAVVDGAVVQEQAPGLPAPVNLRSPRLEATRALVAAPQAELTTCPLPMDHAHYRLRVARLEVEPGRWVRAWHAVLYDTGIPIFYWPYLQFSLTNPRAGQFGPPEVGVGAREGWYVKGRVPYLGPGDRYGYVLLDYYEKMGPGLGLYQALYDDGQNLAAAMARYVPNPSGRVPDLQLGLEGRAQVGGGAGELRTQGGQRDEFGAVVREGDLAARVDAPAWGLSAALDGLTRDVEGAGGGPVPPAPGTWLQGQLRLRPPEQGPLRLEADGRWDVNTIDPDPTLRRVLWDLRGRLAWRPPGFGGRLEVSAGGAHETHPDLFADPVGQRNLVEWVFVERLPEVGVSYTLLQGRAAGVPVSLTLSGTGARVVEARRDSGAGGSGGSGGSPIGGEPLALVEDRRLTAEPRLDLGPVAWGRTQVRGAAALWGAWYGKGQRQAAWLGDLESRYRLTESASLSARYQLTRPTGLLDGGGAQGSPFKFDSRQLEDWLTLGAAVGEGRPSGGSVQARYLASQGYWKDVVVQAYAGRGGPVSVGLYALYEPPYSRWTRVVGWAELRAGGGEAAVAVRLRPDVGAVDEVAARTGWKLSPAAELRVGASYNPRESRLLRSDVEVSLRVAPEWVLSGAVSFDRSLGGLQRAEVGVTWDQDCRSVALRYDHSQQAVALVYQIRGFPQPLVGRPGRSGLELFRPEPWNALLARLQAGS